MAEPFISEIRLFSFNFAPKSWAKCDGQQLPINQNQALFSLLGTTYGGNGQTTFALPDLRGRTPMHEGSGHALGERGGEESHTLSTPEMPEHQHSLTASATNADQPTGANNYFGGALNNYAPPQNPTTLAPSTVTSVGGSQPHMNMQPFLTLNFCIALQGIYPSRD